MRRDIDQAIVRLTGKIGATAADDNNAAQAVLALAQARSILPADPSEVAVESGVKAMQGALDAIRQRTGL